MRKMKKYLSEHSGKRYFLLYSIIFAAAFAAAYLTFWKNDLSFVQHPDGFQQYYPKMVYIRRFLIELLSNFLQGNFVFPQFDLNIGLGEDIFSIMGPWIMDLPFSLVSVFFSENNFELYYSLNIIVKMYLAGLSFSYVCKKVGKRDLDTLIGAICYVFSGYLLRIGPMHPAYICPFILLPLIIYGLEKILKKEKPYLFMVSFSLILIRGYYFAYMATILVFLYGVTRYFNLYKGKPIKYFFQIFIKAVGYYCVAFLMGIGTFIPTIAAFFNSTRDSGQQFEGVLYSLSHYQEFIVKLISPPGDYDFPALFAVVLPFLLLQFLKKDRESRLLKILLIECGVLLILPVAGRVMNGFAYPSNRWSFAFVFLVCFCVASGFSEIFSLGRKLWKHILAGTVIFNGVYLWCLLTVRGYENLLPLIMLDAFVGLIIFPGIIRRDNLVKYAKVCTIFLVAINLVLNGQMTFGGKFANIAVEYSQNGTVNEKISQTTFDFDFESYDNGIYRIDSTNITNENFSIVENVSTPSIYYSVINSVFSDFLGEIHSLNAAADFRISGVDNRVQTESLLGVRYYITTDMTRQYLPYGAKLLEELGQGYYLYENPYALPLVYTYDSYISEKDFEKLNPVEKQSVMLSAAVTDKTEDVAEYEEVSLVEESSFELTEVKGLSWDDEGTLSVDSYENYMEFKVDRKKNTELYLAFYGLGVEEAENPTMTIGVSCGEVYKTIEVTEENYTWHYDNENPWLNLGIRDKDADTIRISFSSLGRFSLDDIKIYQNSLEHLSDQVESKGSNIEDLNYETNTFSCKVQLDKAEIINFSVPYSDGWTLYVDGQEKDIFKVNNLSIGAELSAGEHDIKLVYRTPYLAVAFGLTFAGWFIFTVLFIIEKCHKNRRGQEG